MYTSILHDTITEVSSGQLDKQPKPTNDTIMAFEVSNWSVNRELIKKTFDPQTECLIPDQFEIKCLIVCDHATENIRGFLPKGIFARAACYFSAFA
jgi:hypothetical protein